MNGSGKDKVLEKIRKLLALSKDPANENEAALAAVRVQELMTKHDIALGEVEISRSEVVELRFDTLTQQPHSWMLYLASTVGNAFDCRVYRMRGLIVFVGLETDTKVCEHMYDYLVRAVKRFYKVHLEALRRSGEWEKHQRTGPRIYMSSYASGLVIAIERKLMEYAHKKTTDTETGGMTQALVAVKSAKVDDYFESLTLRSGRRSGGSHNSLGYYRGVEDGKAIPINTPIEKT